MLDDTSLGFLVIINYYWMIGRADFSDFISSGRRDVFGHILVIHLYVSCGLPAKSMWKWNGISGGQKPC